MTENQHDDLPILRSLDEEFGWVEPDGSSPSSVAESLGMRAVIIGVESGLPQVAWGNPSGVWALPAIYEAPLLARSPRFLTYLVGLNLTKEQKSALHSRRYNRWCCTKDAATCDCQNCRVARGCVKGCRCLKCQHKEECSK